MRKGLIVFFIVCLLFVTACSTNLTPCGYGGTSGMWVDCACDGEVFPEHGDGASTYYCDGACGPCKCFVSDTYAREDAYEVNCSELYYLNWSFPLEN